MLLVLAWIIDVGLSSLLKKSCDFSGEFEVWNQVYESESTPDIAIYGSSRAWTHFDPEIIENKTGKTVYNYGLDGHNFWLQYLRHHELSKYNKQSALIVLSVDVFSLQKRKDLFNYNQFLPYMLWDRDIFKYTSSYEGFQLIDYAIPLYRYYGKSRARQSILDEITSKGCSQPKRKNGFKAQKKYWSKDFEKALKNKKFYEAELHKPSIALFEKFILECKRNGIQLILVYSPEYYEGQKYMKNRNEIITIFKNFAKLYDLDYMDYSNSSLCSEKKYFYNATHLNKLGATLFSQKFANDLKAYLETDD